MWILQGFSEWSHTTCCHTQWHGYVASFPGPVSLVPRPRGRRTALFSSRRVLE